MQLKSIWKPIVGGGALWWIAAAWVDAHPPVGPEAVALRWIRALAEHPVRGPAALALGAWALGPGSGADASQGCEKGL